MELKGKTGKGKSFADARGKKKSGGGDSTTSFGTKTQQRKTMISRTGENAFSK